MGDLHVENFGTWRDVEGRLVWGVNDFDEVYRLPFTLDLIRLAVSAHLAIDGAHLSIGHRDACDALLAGYTKGLEDPEAAMVLAEHHEWLRHMVTGELRDPVLFWRKMDALPTLRKAIPKTARPGVGTYAPRKGWTYRIAHRQAGLGSLGRERYVALAEYRGRQDGSRGQSSGAFGVCLGRRQEGVDAASVTVKYSSLRFAARIRLCTRKAAGLCGDWRRIARDRTGVDAQSSGRNQAVILPWDLKQPMSIWERKGAARRSRLAQETAARLAS